MRGQLSVPSVEYHLAVVVGLARDNQQQGSLAEDGTTSGRGGDQEKEMEMDRSHPQKGTDIHNTPGSDLESPGKEKEGAT